MKFLILDDSAIMRQAIKNIVAQPGDETVECPSGMGVVGAYEAFRPDWVLMDIKMEPVNGIEATQELKAAHPEARIAIVTHYGDEEFRDAAKAAGADAFFLKDNLSVIRQKLHSYNNTHSNHRKEFLS